jgi:hypothetical protein
MLRLRWSTTDAAIGEIIATGAGATTIAIGQNTMTTAIVDADIESACDQIAWLGKPMNAIG